MLTHQVPEQPSLQTVAFPLTLPALGINTAFITFPTAEDYGVFLVLWSSIGHTTSSVWPQPAGYSHWLLRLMAV